MGIIFVDQDPDWKNLLPLTYTKPIAKLRLGILTIEEKWNRQLEIDTKGFITEPYLQKAFPLSDSNNESHLYINSSHLPNKALADSINKLKEHEVLFQNNNWIAYRGSSIEQINDASPTPFKEEVIKINRSWDLIQSNASEITTDFLLIKYNQTSLPNVDKNTITYNPKNIFIEEGATIKASILNAENGPIYIGKNAKIHEGAIIKGPFAICEEGEIVMGSKIREGCTIGKKAIGGGELKNTIIGDYSNKCHDGYLGDSIIGNWCNLGALTNVSNLKNTYSKIKVWDKSEASFIDSNTNKLGCILGDYTHTGISTTLTAGTISEPFCQLFGAGIHAKFTPAFSWGEPNKYQNYKLEKALLVAATIQELKNREITNNEIEVLKAIHQLKNA